jgi:hypothetical protein
LERACSVAVPGSVSQWIGASGAVSAGSTKGMETPALAAGGQACDAPDRLAGGQTAGLGVTGREQPVVSLVVRIAAQAFPGDFLVVEREHVVVRAGGRWPNLGR